jgi:hypothetical protein
MQFVKKNDKKLPGCSILPTESNLEEDIETMELISAACIFNSDIRIRKYGKNVWKTAAKMRDVYGLQKSVVFHSDHEEIFLIKQREFRNVEDLDYMIRDRQTCWGMQGFLVCNRILKKRGCSLNTFVVENFFKSALCSLNRKLALICTSSSFETTSVFSVLSTSSRRDTVFLFLQKRHRLSFLAEETPSFFS